MKVSRRDFLKLSGVTVTAAALSSFGFRSAEASDYKSIRISYAKEVTTICPFCAVGCGIICHVRDGKMINAEGDPDHPINEGSLCSKGSSLFNMMNVYAEKGESRPNTQRMTKVLYRAPYASDWEVKSWDWALSEIAKRIKQTRDKSFVGRNGSGVTVNRTPALAWLGSAMCNNEENYLFHKFARALGIVNIDHCARL
jgi:formate dehydrogenase major subunit